MKGKVMENKDIIKNIIESYLNDMNQYIFNNTS